MKGFQKSKAKCLIAIVLVFALAISGWGIGKGLSDAAGGAGTPESANLIKNKSVKYTPATDSLQVTGYPFYTTAKVTDKKVPASNQWIRTESNGVVDLSAIPAATTLYFAKTAEPASPSDIVAVKIPAQPALTTAIYKPQATGELKDKFEFGISCQKVVLANTAGTKTKTVTQKYPVSTDYIEVRLNDNSGWVKFSTLKNTDLDKLQRFGGNISVRLAASTTVSVTYNESSDIFEINDVSIPTGSGKNVKYETPRFVADEKNYDVKGEDGKYSEGSLVGSAVVRPGVSKVIKIAKRALGPVASIDYANHAVNITKAQSVGLATVSTAVASDPTNWINSTTIGDNWLKDSKGKDLKTARVYFGTDGTVTGVQNWGVKTNATAKAPDSLTSFFQVPVDVTLASSAKVTMTGIYKSNATLRVVDTAANTAYNNKVSAAENEADRKKAEKGGESPVAYQYAIVDMNDGGTWFSSWKTTKANAVLNYEKVSTAAWTNIKTTGKGYVDISLAWEKVEGKQVLVRKAAVPAQKTFSSSIEIFVAPKAANQNWGKVVQTDATAANVITPTGTSPSVYGAITYKNNGVFDVASNSTLGAANVHVDKVTSVKVTINKKPVTKNATVKATVDKNSKKVTKVTVTVEGMPGGTDAKTKIQDVTIAFPDGFFDDAPAFSVTLKDGEVTTGIGGFDFKK